MALSFCYNWEAAAMEHPIADTIEPLFEDNSEVADALLGFLDPVDSPLLPFDTFFDTQESDDLLSSPSPPFATADNSITVPSFSETTMHTLPPPPCDDCLVYRCPKRHRSYSDLYLPSLPPPLFQPSPLVLPSVGPTPSAGFAIPPPLCMAVASAGGGGGGSLSLQSVAARERRKRISEKTQELGRLIPGGSKMNTAEMLHAAHKYVRFLQVQIAILGLMGSTKVSSCPPEDHLQVLLASPAIQERLSNEGRCIVPKVMVDRLSEDPQVKSSQLISKAMGRFIESISDKTDK